MKLGWMGWVLTGLCAAYGGEGPVWKLGAGFGNAFGAAGVGVEMETPDLALLVGMGYNAADRTAFDVGARYYFRKQDQSFRPSVTFSYAPLEVLSYSSTPLNIDKSVNVMGFNLLGGVDQDIGIKGDFIFSYGVGLGYPVYSGAVRQDYRDAGAELPRKNVAIAFSLGIKYQL